MPISIFHLEMLWLIIDNNKGNIQFQEPYVVYFDQRTHACSRIRRVENDQKHLKMSKKVSFSSFAWEAHVRHTQKNEEKRKKRDTQQSYSQSNLSKYYVYWL